MRVAQLVAEPAFHLLTGDGRNELVAAHPDVPVQPPDGDDDPVAPKRPEPCERMLVVRVHEGAVEVEEDGDVRAQ
jgi:hypothetical protein